MNPSSQAVAFIALGVLFATFWVCTRPAQFGEPEPEQQEEQEQQAHCTAYVYDDEPFAVIEASMWTDDPTPKMDDEATQFFANGGLS